jgi:AcrR family transcriptional regulator
MTHEMTPINLTRYGVGPPSANGQSMLRSGRSGLARDQVFDIQRGRIVAAAAEVVEAVGYPGMSVEEIVTRAKLSRKTFYEIFANREDCFLATFEYIVSEAAKLVGDVYGQTPEWPDGVRMALARLLRLMEEESGLAKLCVVDALAAGERVLARRAEVLGEVAAIVDRGRLLSNPSCEPPQVTAEGIVGGIAAVLYTRLLEPRGPSLTDLLGPLMSMIVLPYLGSKAAQRELGRPLPSPSASPARATRPVQRDPLEGLKMRLTYRTVSVLVAIAQHPDASNREVAEHSGIVDQGQISKLLSRLARLDLVENRGEGQQRGAANAWRLTSRGVRLEHATRTR